MGRLAGHPSAEHLYPDAAPCLRALRAQGLLVGLAGNQPARAEAILKSIDLDVDVVATSDGWGVKKPSLAFFERLVREAGHPPERILYVWDRLDNDIRPALEAGLQTALIRRGPWAYILDQPEVARRCLFKLNSLAELPDLLLRHNTPA